MKFLIKLLGGVVVGAAAGVGAYLLLTSEDEEGFVADLKSLVNDVVAEGKRAAELRRLELETELGQRPGTPEVV